MKIEQGALVQFSKVLGISDPVHLDEKAAKSAGCRNVVAPPTYGFSINLMNPSKDISRDAMGVDITKVLHGEQEFENFVDICAGDEISIVTEIADFYAKKGGALTFVVSDTSLTNQLGELCVKMRNVMVVRA